MRSLYALFLRLLGTIRPVRRDREFDIELESHLQLHIDDNIRAGLPPEEARRRALLALGGVEQTKEGYRDRRGLPIFEHAVYDLRLAVRSLARRRLLLAAALTSIAIGVGANVAVYNILRQVFSTQWIVASDPDRLVTIWPGLSYPNFLDLRRSDPPVDLAVFTMTSLTWRTSDLTTNIAAHVVSDNFFELTGTRAIRGRIFETAKPGELAEPNRVLLSYAFWQRLGGNDSIVGQTVMLNGRQYTILGVLPREFHFSVGPMMSASVFLPVSPAVATALDRREAGYFDVIGRLRPGVVTETALSSLRRTAQTLESAFPEQNRDFARDLNMISGAISPIRLMVQLSPQGRIVLTLAAAMYALVGLILLIACANVAGLLTVRANERRHEIAVRTALGASRARLIQQSLAESLIIAVLGCTAGGLLWTGCMTIVPRLRVIVDSGIEIVPGSVPFYYCAGLAVIVTIACGLAPALTSSQVAPVVGLKAGRMADIVRGMKLQNILVGGQVALSFVLLTAALALLHTFFLLRMVDPGYDILHTAVVTLRPGANSTISGAELRSLLEGLPGIDSVSYGELPLGVPLPRTATVRRVSSSESPALGIQLHPAGPRFLETMRIPLQHGRDLNDQDLIDGAGVTAGTVVNETFARRYLDPGDPIGQEIVLNRNSETGRADRRLRIVGVARDTKMRSLADEDVPVLYLAAPSLSLVIRTRDIAGTRTTALERTVADRFPGATVTTTTMAASMDTALLPARIAATLLSILGGIGLTLAMIGLNAIVSYSVTRRSFEIGLRVALGATRVSVIRLILRGATRVVATGVAIGMMISFAVLHVLRPLLASGQSAFDPLAVAGVVAILVGAGAIASIRPARRTASVDPMVALRSE